jgi:hypothetical protein
VAETAVEPKKNTVAYVPYRTFISALDSLANGLPHQIDRSVFPSLSGVTQSQLIGAFKFMGLITDDGKPTDDLQKLVEEKSQRKAHLHRIISKSYPKIIQMDLSKMTPNGLDVAFRDFGLTGETNVKAKSFFLQAAKEADFKLSPYLQKVTRTSVSRRKRTAASSDGVKPETDPIESSRMMESSGVKKVIFLDNGATLSLVLDKNFGELPSNQRKFVNRMIDEMEDFVEEMNVEDEEKFAARNGNEVSS